VQRIIYQQVIHKPHNKPMNNLWAICGAPVHEIKGFHIVS